MRKHDIERLIRTGGHLLSDALHAYWPLNGVNEIGEANITLHLARSFSDAGFACYAEGHTEGSTDTRLDLLALHVGAGVQVAIEAKRLYNAGQAASMLHDVDRLTKYSLPNAAMLPAPPAHRFGVIIATTWNDDYARWFSRNDADHPKGEAVWEALEHHESLRSAKWGSLVLRGWDARLDHERFHYLVYAIFDS